MIEIDYNFTNYSEMLQHFAATFKVKIKNNVLQLPEHIGNGYMKLIELPNGLQGIVSDYTSHTDLRFNWLKINQDCFILRFDEANIPENSMTSTTSVTPDNSSQVRSAVFLANSRYDWIFICKKGTQVKGVNILFTKEWLEQFLKVESVGEVIRKYLNLRLTTLNHEPMDIEYKRLLNEIVQVKGNPDYETMIIQNRIMLLLERFFTRTYYKMSDMHFNVKMSNEVISRLANVERELIKDFSADPKSIPELAKMAAMSPSKLKNCFKEIYGLPVYQYFQKKRMHKAKAMLVSRKYSVREVGMEVGYSNLSNFAKAFKKSFDQLPSDLL